MRLHVRHIRVAILLVLGLALLAQASPAAAQGGSYEQTVSITFPTDPRARFTEGYHDPRDGGARVHKATDIMGQKMYPLYSAVNGYVCYITGIDEPMPSWGYSVTICGRDGRSYHYLHVNNDTPGTDDGLGGPRWAYAPGIHDDARVARGQFIGWMGDSGNAEGTSPHLHFEIHDDSVTDPYGDHRIDPYASLMNALARNDIPDGTAVYTEPLARLAGPDRVATAIALSRARFRRATWAVIAPSDSPAEPLVAGPLARELRAPILTTAPTALDPRIGPELRRLGVDGVVLVGASLDPSFDGALTDLGLAPESIIRLAGPTRYATAAAVARELWALQAEDGATTHRAVVALGDHPDPSRAWPDALTGSWYGAATGAAVLLVKPDAIPGATKATLREVDEAVVLGGDVAILPNVYASIDVHAGRVRRIAGATRYSTATAVASELLRSGAASLDTVWAATGTNWPDAVTAGPAAAAAGDVFVLIDGTGAGADHEAIAWLTLRRDDIDRGRVLGGEAAVTGTAARGFGLAIT